MNIRETKIDPKLIMGTGFTPFELRSDDKSLCTGTYLHKENYINIFGVWSKNKGDMKKFINYLVEKFKTDDIVFYCILNLDLLWKVKGFEVFVMEDSHHKENVLCLKGKWKSEKQCGETK